MDFLIANSPLSAFALFGAIELGLVYALVAIGVFLTFRVLDFPDLTVDGSFPLGAAIAAAMIVAGWDPWSASGVAMIGGALAGLVTAFLAVRCGILHILASILTMIALFSINIRIMGRPNVALLGVDTVLTPFQGLGLSDMHLRPAFTGIVVVIAMLLVIRLLNSEFGLGLRATGVNPRMLRANGGNTSAYTYFGLALSNALVALGGALFAQTNGFADVTTGVGTIVVGLASVILGETLLPGRRIWVMVLACVIGSVLYRIAIAFALNTGDLGLQASDLNLLTAVLVALALVAPKLRAEMRARALRRQYAREGGAE